MQSIIIIFDQNIIIAFIWFNATQRISEFIVNWCSIFYQLAFKLISDPKGFRYSSVTLLLERVKRIRVSFVWNAIAISFCERNALSFFFESTAPVSVWDTLDVSLIPGRFWWIEASLRWLVWGIHFAGQSQVHEMQHFLMAEKRSDDGDMYCIVSKSCSVPIFSAPSLFTTQL